MKAKANEKVVYILGAGFSAPFGLPVMSNFLEKSKDIYAIRNSISLNEDNIDFFGNVYQEIDKFRRCKDFYASDMTNIEEILSLFEMRKMLGVESEGKIDFQKFIAQVISYYTPTEPGAQLELFSLLRSFIKRLMRIKEATENGISYNDELPFYSVLTFNYDMLWENALLHYNQKYLGYNIGKLVNEYNQKYGNIPYIKLHGTASEPQSIVTPTWKKSFENKEASNWGIAGKILAEANHIRIIGYSLPITDSYLKYFLKWGVTNDDSNLKSIDVICLDDEQHSVEKRYQDFIHKKLNFYNNSTDNYLKAVECGIEDAHQNLFEKSPRVQWG